MGVLAVQAFLVAVDHGLPVEVAFVLDAAAVGQLCEIDLCEEWLEVGVEIRETWGGWG